MRGRLIIPVIAIIVLSFLSLSFAVERVQTKPGVVQTRPIQVTPVELPDLVVESIWLDSQCHINFKLRNTGKGNIPDGEHRESVVRIQFGSEIKDFPLPRIDSNGVLKKPAGLVSFNTQVVLKSSVDVKVIADFNRKIKETDSGEKNNEKVAKLTPQCPSVIQGSNLPTDNKVKGDLIAKTKSGGESLPLKSDKPLQMAPGSKGYILKTQGASDTGPPVSIKVTSPSKGEIFDVGKSCLIRWTVAGQMNNTVKIMLYPAGQPHLADAGQFISVTSNAPNNGAFNWSIPTDSRTGKFVIRVQTVDDVVKGDSEVITISEKGPVQGIKAKAPDVGSISIKIISPSPIAPSTTAYLAEGAMFFIQWEIPDEYFIYKPKPKDPYPGPPPDEPFIVDLLNSSGGLHVQRLHDGPVRYDQKGVFSLGWYVPSGLPAYAFQIKVIRINPFKPNDLSVYALSKPFYIQKASDYPTPKQITYKIKAIQYTRAAWACPKLDCITKITVQIQTTTNSDFKLGEWGHPDYGSLAVKCVLANQVQSFYWDTFLNKTFSIKGGGGSKLLTYPKGVIKAGQFFDVDIELNPPWQDRGVKAGGKKYYPVIDIDLFGYTAWGTTSSYIVDTPASKDSKKVEIHDAVLIELPPGPTITGTQ